MLKQLQSSFAPHKKKFDLSDRQKDEIHAHFVEFKKKFLAGAIFSAVRDIITITFEDQRPPFDIFSIVFDSIDTGLELSTYGFISSAASTVYRPNLKSLRREIPYVAACSVASAALNRAVSVPLENLLKTNTLSFKGYFKELQNATVQGIGFNGGLTLAYRYLPKPERMCGEFAHSSASVCIGNLGAAALSAPFEIAETDGSVKKVLQKYYRTLPLALFDNSLYTIVQKHMKYLK